MKISKQSAAIVNVEILTDANLFAFVINDRTVSTGKKDMFD